MTDEHRREQCRRLVAEAAPQPLGVRLVLQPAVRATLKVRESALGENFAGRLPVLQREDCLCPVPAEPAGVVEQLEAFALSLTRAGGVARLVDRDVEHRRDSAVLQPLDEPSEDALLVLVQFGLELQGDQTILLGEHDRLGRALFFSRLGHETQARTPLRLCLSGLRAVSPSVRVAKRRLRAG
jgi:hypothetical protein